MANLAADQGGGPRNPSTSRNKPSCQLASNHTHKDAYPNRKCLRGAIDATMP